MLFSLRQSDGLRDVCSGTLQLLQKSVNLVIKSMTIIFEERRYWRYVLDAGPLEKVKISFLHAGPMGFVSSIRRLLFQAKLYNNESSIDLKLAILRETFNKLASILGSLYQCGRVLKEISSDIEDMAFTVIDVVDENSSTSDSSTHASNVGIVNKDLIFVTFIEKSKERLWWALKNIVEAYESLDKFSDVSLSSDDESVHDNNGAIQSNLPEMLAYATARFTRIEVFFFIADMCITLKPVFFKSGRVGQYDHLKFCKATHTLSTILVPIFNMRPCTHGEQHQIYSVHC